MTQRRGAPLDLRKILPLLAGSLLLLAGCGSPSGDANVAATGNTPAPTAARPKIAVIPKGTTHAFWKAVEAGARQAGQEMGAEILWKGSLKEDDRAGQIGVVQSFTADDVAGIVLAPLDDSALVASVKSATGKGIPVVVIDSALKGEVGKDFVSMVATDNRKAGELGAEKLATEMGSKGKVVLLRYAVGSASTNEREEGFLAKIKTYPDIQVISENAYGGATQAESLTKAMQMVDILKQADGVFTPNESSTLGMLRALGQIGIAGKVKFVGFDATPEQVDNLKSGLIHGLVAQNPTKMGYEGVKAVMAKIKGQTVSPGIDTGVMVIDRANLESEPVQKLLAGK